MAVFDPFVMFCVHLLSVTRKKERKLRSAGAFVSARPRLAVLTGGGSNKLLSL